MKKTPLLFIFFLFFAAVPSSLAKEAVSISGLLEARYSFKEAQGQKVEFGKTYRNGLTYNLELYPKISLDDNWNITAVICHAKNSTGKDEDPFDLYRIAVNGKIGKAELTVGSFKYWPMNGLVHGDARLDGVKLIFGQSLKTTLVLAKDMGWRHRDEAYRGINFDYAPTAKIAWRGGFFTQKHQSCRKNLWALGTDVHLDKKFVFVADYAFSDYGQNNNSYIVGFNYQGGKYPSVNKKGHFGAWLHWLQVTPNGTLNADTDVPDMDGWHNNNGNKGISTGVAYMLAKNVKWSAKFFNFKDVVTNENSKVYRTQVECFF